MTLKIVAVVVALVAGVVVYVVVLRGPADQPHDPLAYDRKQCGSSDPLQGDKLEHCVSLAWDLMGRADVKIDDDAARALLKRTCDQAYEPACNILKDFASNKVSVQERRCEGASFAADAEACVAVGRAFEDGVGRDRSWTMALQWYERACTLGLEEGCASKEK